MSALAENQHTYKIKEKNIARSKQTQRYFDLIDIFEQEMILQLLEFPSSVRGIYEIKNKIKNDSVKVSSIVKLLGTHETVTGYYDENLDLKAGHVSMLQRNDLINSLEKQERFFLENKSLPFVFYDILKNYNSDFLYNEQKNFILKYAEYKKNIYNELKFCNFNQEFYNEEINELQMLISQWRNLHQDINSLYDKIQIPIQDFEYYVYRMKKNEITWDEFAINIKVMSKDAATYLYDEYIRIKRVEKAYKQSFPFPLETADEILNNIMFLKRRITFYKDRILNENVSLAKKIANDFMKKFLKDKHGIEQEDLIQEAIFGLRKAIDKYDSEKDTVFSTYAYKWVMQSIKLSLENMQDSNMKVPGHAQISYAKIKRYISECEEAGYMPDTNEIAEYLSKVEGKKFTEKQITNILNSQRATVSFYDSQDDDNKNSLEERLLTDQNSSCLEDEFTRSSLGIKINEALKQLTPMEEKVIRQIYNLDKSEVVDKKIKEIAKKENLSSQSIRLELQHGLTKLKQIFSEDEDFIETFRPF